MTETAKLSIGGASTIRKSAVVNRQPWDRTEFGEAELSALLDGTCPVLRIKNYFPEATCRRLAETLLQSGIYGRYVNAPEIGRVGQAFFECQANEEAARRYQTESVCWIRQLREAFGPTLTPIDRLRLELDEAWPAGAILGSMSGYKMFAGLARHFVLGAYAEPHQDVLHWDAPNSREAQEVVQQIAANIYLTVADQGGELALWDRGLSREEYQRLGTPGSYGLQRDEIGPPDIIVQPSAGDLILFDAGKIHSVEAIRDGDRVTWSAFVGYRGHARPLVVWS